MGCDQRRAKRTSGESEENVVEVRRTRHEVGPDFDVFSVWTVGPLLEFGGSIGVYIGGHPSFHYYRAEGTGDVVPEDGTLLGDTMTWHRWVSVSQGGDVRYRLEAIVPHPSMEYLAIHAFMRAPDEATLERLRQVVETLRIVP